MHLIQKVQDDAHSFVIDTQVLHQISDQFRTRQIRLGKRQFSGCSAGNQPFLFDPYLQGFKIELRAIKKFQLADDHGCISRRGS